MESLLFAGISLLILFPILYFLPLGFTIKGKVFIVVASFVTGLVGLAASVVFPLWQTALILMLFVSTATYLINKQGKKWLYLPEVYYDPFFVPEITPDPPVKEVVVTNSYSYIAHSDNKVESEAEKKTKKSTKKQKTVKQQASQTNLLLVEEQIAATNQKLELTTLLEKLVVQNEHELSLFRKPYEDEHDEDEIDEPESSKEDLSVLKQPELEDLNDLAEMEASILVDIQLESITVVEPKLQSDSVTAITTDDMVLDIEDLLEEEDEPLEELDYSSVTLEHSHDYMSEIEKMIETDGHEFDRVQPVIKTPIPTHQTDDILEVISISSVPTEVTKKDDTAPAPNTDEGEIEELSLEDLFKEIDGNKVQDRKVEIEQIYDLEEIVFPVQASQQSANIPNLANQEAEVVSKKLIKQ